MGVQSDRTLPTPVVEGPLQLSDITENNHCMSE